jgi:hypothetical protein
VLWQAKKVGAQQGMNANWTFGEHFVMVSEDTDKGVQIAINSDAMMMHPFHLQ